MRVDFKIGDNVIFILFNRETIGVVKGFIKQEVLVGIKAGDLRINRRNIIRKA